MNNLNWRDICCGLLETISISVCCCCCLLSCSDVVVVAIGESGSGKTESTNFLLHHLTALSQKGSQGCGVEQTILSAGPVLEVYILF